MFKKTTSNPRGRKTDNKMRQEWLSKLRAQLIKQRSPLYIGLMSICMLSSFIYLLYSRNNKPADKPVASTALLKPIESGISGIISSAAGLSEIIKLQGELEPLLAQDSLSRIDSITMERALDHMQRIEKQLGWSAENSQDTSLK